jgi:hypothetical protein
MRHRLSIFLIAVGGIGSPYFAWALHRVSDTVLVRDMAWPRSWPYPDRWLAVLNAWYDARHPAPPDSLKIHGELPQVRASVTLVLVACLFWLAAGVRMRLAGRSSVGRSEV